MINQSFGLGAIVMYLDVTRCTGVTLPVLNQLLSSGEIVMHLGPWIN